MILYCLHELFPLQFYLMVIELIVKIFRYLVFKENWIISTIVFNDIVVLVIWISNAFKEFLWLHWHLVFDTVYKQIMYLKFETWFGDYGLEIVDVKFATSLEHCMMLHVVFHVESEHIPYLGGESTVLWKTKVYSDQFWNTYFSVLIMIKKWEG